MSDCCLSREAIQYLQKVVDVSLIYGIKSPDTELFDLGFGAYMKRIRSDGTCMDFPSYALHILCEIKVIWKKGKRATYYYDASTSVSEFDLAMRRLFGLKVRRVELSDKNDLWLDFGDCWVVLITHESGQESWRFITSNKSEAHLVVSDVWQQFVY